MTATDRFLMVRLEDVQQLGRDRAWVLAGLRNRLKRFRKGVVLGPLADDLDLSYRQLERRLTELEELGRVRRIRRGKFGWVFEVLDADGTVCIEQPDRVADSQQGQDKVADTSCRFVRSSNTQERNKKEGSFKRESHKGAADASRDERTSPLVAIGDLLKVRRSGMPPEPSRLPIAARDTRQHYADRRGGWSKKAKEVEYKGW